MKKILLIVLFLCFLSVPVYAQSTLALQEKCAEGAKNFFKQHYTAYNKGEDFEVITQYTNHYNKKLDRCFIRVELLRTGKSQPKRMIFLYDAFEGEEYGWFCFDLEKETIFVCYVKNENCNSLGEFDKLIRPYLEE